MDLGLGLALLFETQDKQASPLKGYRLVEAYGAGYGGD